MKKEQKIFILGQLSAIFMIFGTFIIHDNVIVGMLSVFLGFGLIISR